jgi:hypothetical protein
MEVSYSLVSYSVYMNIGLEFTLIDKIRVSFVIGTFYFFENLFLFFSLFYRIRLAIMQHIPHLAKQLGKDFFSEKLTTHCVGWLRDDISTIRQAAAENLKVYKETTSFCFIMHRELVYEQL